MLRAAALGLVAALVAFPLAVLPSPPVTWVAGAALALAGAGVLGRLVPLVTAGASLALIAHALALVIARPAVDAVAAAAFGATLVLLLALVHFAARVRGAEVGPSVVAAQVRRWLAVVAAGVVAAGVLAAGGAVLGPALGGATLPVVVVAAGLGALIAAAGLVALVTRRPG
ncbi:MAG TPA: hypothetical protein VFV05_26125 [Methylomirabilota bacterium]|nr:hypothetical protein [Methylomirabilota bacterium]